MQQHINDGCPPCAATLKTWQDVLAITASEGELTPPADVVRVVKAQLAAMLPASSRGIRLLFDSRLEPVTAGIRGSVAAGQFLFETDLYYIDLRLEPRQGTEKACLVGQILPQRGTQSRTEGVTVRVRHKETLLAETIANQFGEFQLEFDAVDDLYVSISGNEGSEILLPLYGVCAK